jgi:hypothetical protein
MDARTDRKHMKINITDRQENLQPGEPHIEGNVTETPLVKPCELETPLENVRDDNNQGNKRTGGRYQLGVRQNSTISVVGSEAMTGTNCVLFFICQ